MHGPSARARRALYLTLAVLAAQAAPVGAQGVMRDLSCRGNTGMVLRVDQDPSPRDTSRVVMVLEYRRPTKAPGNDLRALEPGTCTWNPLGFEGVPAEPGRVRFEVAREAQRWSATGTRAMDTTIRAAVFFPDPITLPRYLLDPARYWKFYVNDVSNLSTSHGAMFESGLPTYVNMTGPVQLANDVRRDLLCRGGTSGLLYGGGATVGNNLAKVQLTYRVSPNVPGPTGSGLAAGSCAWASRTAMPPEPGKIWFMTASNAQLRQAQSGVPLDRSPTAAERYPDVRSIPEYLKDPAHYWTFAVVSRDPDSAVTNGVWKPDLSFMASSPRDAATATVRAQPTTSGTAQPYTAGAATATTRVQTLFDIRNVTATAGLEGVTIRFEAAANSKPTVTLTPAAGGAAITLATSSGVPISTGMARYSAASQTKLARGSSYTYLISAPATAQARANEKSGSVKTLGQQVTVVFTQLRILQDGDNEGDGELWFSVGSCPDAFAGKDPLYQYRSRVWKEGTVYRLSGDEMKSQGGSAPDQFRILVYGYEDDRGAEDLGLGWAPGPSMPTCGSGTFDISPGWNRDGEWNSIAIDFDLSKYPGVKAGDQFIRRSKPLVSNTRVMFEIRGSFVVTRQ